MQHETNSTCGRCGNDVNAVLADIAECVNCWRGHEGQPQSGQRKRVSTLRRLRFRVRRLRCDVLQRAHRRNEARGEGRWSTYACVDCAKKREAAMKEAA